MKNINLSIENHFQKNIFSKNILKKFETKYKKILKDIRENLNYENKTENILSKNYKFNFNFKSLKNFKRYNSIVIIGMGGSIMGTEAIYNFFKNKIKKKVYFLNNIDIEKIKAIKKTVNFKKTLFIVTSKSGNTIETLANTFYLKVLSKNKNNIVIISEKKNNYLFSISKKMNLFYVEHKNSVGGRYSVLSEVGIIPSYLFGLNIKKLRNNLSNCLFGKDELFLKNSSIKLAILLNKTKYKNLVFKNYEPSVEKFLFWCQQLIAESLGKNGKGFFPVISNGPKDHHSLLQLYLDGPKDKLFYIFSSDHLDKDKLKVRKFNKNLNFLNNKSLSQIKLSQKNALIKTLKKNKIPFREFKIKKDYEGTLGRLFSYFILETIIVGKLSGLNPFDQPAVEQVKKYTKQILS